MVHTLGARGSGGKLSASGGMRVMRLVVLAAGTPAEVQRALALAEELAEREQLHVQRRIGAVGTLVAGIEGAEVRCLCEHTVDEPHPAVAEVGDAALRDVLAAAHDGTWFLFRGRYVDLSARRVLSRVLMALLHARLATPGRCLPPTELVAAVWPDERMQVSSAVNRLRVALSTLRRFGLREVLCSRDGGVLLDTSIEVLNVIEDASDRVPQ